MAQDLATFLQSIPFLAGLGRRAAEELATRAHVRNYARQELVILEGEPAEAVYLVMAGQVRIYKLSAAGREQVLERLGPGEVFNLVPMFDGGPNPASAEAVNALTLCILPKTALLPAIQRYPTVAEALLADLAARVRRLTTLVEDLSFRSVRARLARYLLRQASHPIQEGFPTRPLTQAEMAAELGTVRDVIGRTLADFQAEGLITIERHCIRIRDCKGLKAVGES